MTSKRAEAYAAIDSERDYQDRLGTNRTSGQPHTVGDYITMLQHYQAELIASWVKNPGDAAALDTIRKIAGIAVHCMEDHGATTR